MVDSIEKLKKAELIEKYEELQEEYEDLDQRYNDLDDCYTELENQLSEKQEEIEELEVADGLEKFLRELRFYDSLGKDFNKIFFKFYKDYFIELLKFYCVDIPDAVYSTEYKDFNIKNDEVYKYIEGLAEEF